MRSKKLFCSLRQRIADRIEFHAIFQFSKIIRIIMALKFCGRLQLHRKRHARKM